MSCTPLYVSKVLKGRYDLSLKALSKIEDALDLCLINDYKITNSGRNFRT